MRFRLMAIGSLAALIAATAPLVVRAQDNPTPPPTAAPKQQRQHKEKHPELMKALKALQRAKGDLEHSARDFDGHRSKAQELTEQAIQEVHEAMNADTN